MNINSKYKCKTNNLIKSKLYWIGSAVKYCESIISSLGYELVICEIRNSKTPFKSIL